MNNITFALPSNYDWDVKKFARTVKTLKFAKQYKNQLMKYADKLTSANSDNLQIIGGMLQTAYGVNIGRQIESLLTENDLDKIKTNIIKACYY